MPRGSSGKIPVVVFVSAADEITRGGVRSLSIDLAADGIGW